MNITDCDGIMSGEVIDGVSAEEISVFEALLKSYRDIPPIDDTIKVFKNITEEQLRKNLFEILKSVERHGKITEEETKVLYDIFSGNKTKKETISQGIMSYEDMEDSYGRFINEMQWCYCFLRPYGEHRAKSFSNGTLEFIWTPATYAAEHNMEESDLKDILEKIIKSERILKERNRDRFFELIVKYWKNEINIEQEREKLAELYEEIVKQFEEEIRVMYLSIARGLINEGKINRRDISQYCDNMGYDYQKVCSAMKISGVSPARHPKRRISLLNSYLDD